MADITSNLSAWWRFLEGSGTSAANSVSGGTALTLTNGPTWGAGPFGAAPAINFDGSDDFASLTAITTGTTFTWAAWVKPNSQILQYGCLAGPASGGASGIFMMGSNAGADVRKINVFFSTADHLSTSALTNGSFSHVAVVESAGSGTIYINGAAAGTFTSGQSISFARLGTDGNSELFKGSLADARYYTRALTAADVAALAAWTGFLPAFMGEDE
jgi:hypothetical protein